MKLKRWKPDVARHRTLGQVHFLGSSADEVSVLQSSHRCPSPFTCTHVVLLPANCYHVTSCVGTGCSHTAWAPPSPCQDQETPGNVHRAQSLSSDWCDGIQIILLPRPWSGQFWRVILLQTFYQPGEGEFVVEVNPCTTSFTKKFSESNVSWNKQLA